MSAAKRVQQWATFGRMWYLFDGKWQNPFASADKIVTYLEGTHKPIYHPLNDSGDHVVVINSRDIALPGVEWEKRVYFHHTGYAKGASWTLAWQVHETDPTMIMRKAVYNQMSKNLLRHGRMARLHIFPDDKTWWWRILMGHLGHLSQHGPPLQVPLQLQSWIFLQVPDKILENISAQIRQLRPVPTRLDHLPEEEVENFPRIFDWPKEHIIR